MVSILTGGWGRQRVKSKSNFVDMRRNLCPKHASLCCVIESGEDFNLNPTERAHAHNTVSCEQ